MPAWIRSGILVGGLLATGTVTYASYLGGKIIHDSAVLELKEAPAGFPAELTGEPRDSTVPVGYASSKAHLSHP